MEKQVAIFLVLYIAIVTTLLNIFFFGNKKMMNNPRMKKYFRGSLILGIIFFVSALFAYLSFI
ncbi:MAG: hypothetical protein MUF28_09425 [Ignavibacterium sp.]|jgi:hypothetical protein|nr:hypothetical protein [Ignavibacterium sp.]